MGPWTLFVSQNKNKKKKQENHHRAPAGCKNMTRTRVDQKSAAAEIPGNRLVLKASREEDFSHL